MTPINPEQLRDDLLTLGQLAGSIWSDDQIEVAFQPAPHDYPDFQSDQQGVYAFFYRKYCLKVGKAGRKSKARFVYHHYGDHGESTLAKSLEQNWDRFSGLVDSVDVELGPNPTAEEAGEWLKAECSRVNVYLSYLCGPHARSLIEAFLQCRWDPMYEGL